jgi:DNA-binding transcriptional MerR regulator
VIEPDDSDALSGRKAVKSEAAFRTISEVSVDLDVPQHVLRFWESKFSQIKPLKRGGGRRYYRPEDLALLKRIRDLLYKDGYTIRGVQKLLRDQARGHAVDAKVEPPGEPEVASPPSLFVMDESPVVDVTPTGDEEVVTEQTVRAVLEGLLQELVDLRSQLANARRTQSP